MRRICLSRLFPFRGLGALTLRGRAAPLVARARALALRKLGGREHVLDVHAGHETRPVSTGGRDETCPVSTGGRGEGGGRAGHETGKGRERSLGPASARTPAPSAHRARAHSWRRCGGRRSGAADLRIARRCIPNASSILEEGRDVSG